MGTKWLNFEFGHIPSYVSPKPVMQFQDFALLQPNVYGIYRKHRNGHGGGVLIAVRSSVISRHMPDLFPAQSGGTYILVVKMIIPVYNKIALINYYNPPGNSTNDTSDFPRQTLQSIVTQVF